MSDEYEDESTEYDDNWKGDVQFKGKHGIFQIKSTSGDSIPVHFIQTDVQFDDKVMGKLETFREIFDQESLNLEQILQRDIDDARVSSDMIPYLLSTDYNQQIFRSSLTTFYPPIVAILTPIVTGTNDAGEPISTPGSHYSPAYNAHNEGEKGYHFSVPYGIGENMQAFAKLAQSQEEKYKDNKWAQTELHYVSGSPDESRMWRLKSPAKIKKTEQSYEVRPEFSKTATMEINTDNCKIVIIDGQHRAMSMLALYRNYNPGMWDGSREPFEIFYKEWNRKVVDKALGYDLSSLTLPITVCVVPDGMEGSGVDGTEISKVAREIFLTLNKTAKPVDTIQQQIMDDSNMISELMRKQLEMMYNKDEKWTNSR